MLNMNTIAGLLWLSSVPVAVPQGVVSTASPVLPQAEKPASDESPAGSFAAPVRVMVNNAILSTKGGDRFISPALHDLDGDGRNELVLSGLMGRVSVYRNLNDTGKSDPVWGPREPLMGASGEPIRTSNW